MIPWSARAVWACPAPAGRLPQAGSIPAPGTVKDLPPSGRTRIAPTPSGFLHAGNAINFLLAARLAGATGATLLLRIDDLDAPRVRPEYVEDIFRSLEWLGIAWDEGPSGPEDLAANWSQRLRLPRYHTLLAALREKGVLYACDCSRSVLRQASLDGRYPGTCRDRGLPLDTPDRAWRLRVPDDAAIAIPPLIGSERMVRLADAMGDPVLRQRDGMPAYQIASLADDVDHGITFIVRGEDLLISSACQLHLASLPGLEGFLRTRFLHHPLLLGEDGHKLSKSDGASSLKAMREAGRSPDALHRQADRLLEDLVKAG